MSRELPFDPFPYLGDPHYQTILGSLHSWTLEPGSKTKLISLSGGDKIAMEITTPANWKGSDPTVMLIHGLCGSHKSPCIMRMARKLRSLGIRSVRFNMRGCGSGKGLAKKIAHSGMSEDIFEGIKSLKEEHPDSPLTVAGFSLGANMLLKMAGELNSINSLFLKKVIAVSPPVDLYSSIMLFSKQVNRIYDLYFYRLLRSNVYDLHRKFPELPRVRLPKDLMLYEFDQLYTAPMNGFASARDYYEKCSSVHLIPDISIPVKILLSEDDPIISSSSLEGVRLPSNVDVFKTKKGGHMGYLGHPSGERGVFWLDSVLLDWILED